jgi:cyanophycin synthetase
LRARLPGTSERVGFEVAGEIEKLLVLADDYRLGPSTAAIVREAERRRIPVLRLTPTGSLVQLGNGVHQKRILASETSQTSAIAVEFCQEKPMTTRMLRSVGVPVPVGRTVESAEEAWRAAQEIGLPVVAKPHAGNQGKGVSVNLFTEDEVKNAYAVAAFDTTAFVERYIEGADFRLLIVNGKMVVAGRRDTAQVTGDDVHTVEELVAEVNKDPRRRPGHSNPLTQITLNDATNLVLGQQKLTLQSIPEAGQIVRLRLSCRPMSRGHRD